MVRKLSIGCTGRQRDKNKKQEEKKKDLYWNLLPRFSANASKSKTGNHPVKKRWINWYLKILRQVIENIPGIIFKPEREVGNQILNIEKLSKNRLDGKTMLFSNLEF